MQPVSVGLSFNAIYIFIFAAYFNPFFLSNSHKIPTAARGKG